MDKKKLHAVAQEAAKNIKTEADLNEFRQMLTKILFLYAQGMTTREIVTAFKEL